MHVQLELVKNYFLKKYFIHLPTDVSNTILLSSVGRSGSTWISTLLNSSKTHREIFEPFLPIRVPEANVFGYLQYLSPQCNDIKYVKGATKILEGRLRRQPWIDSGNQAMVSSKRLIKDIRTNLMLGWFHNKFPTMKIILLIRNPFSVVQSFMNLKWGVEPCGSRREIDILLAQDDLLSDYPLIRESARQIDSMDYFESLMFQWCILNYVPLSQAKTNNVLVTFYESYLLNPKDEIRKVYEFTGQRMNPSIFTKLYTPSRTSYSKRVFEIDGIKLDSGLVKRGGEILKLFDLSKLYDEEQRPLVL